MTSLRLTGIRACVFDAYGTLFDVNSAAAQARDSLGEKWQALAELWRTKQLQYTWLRSLAGRHVDFWQVTGDALDFAMASVKLEDAALRERLGRILCEGLWLARSLVQSLWPVARTDSRAARRGNRDAVRPGGNRQRVI